MFYFCVGLSLESGIWWIFILSLLIENIGLIRILKVFYIGFEYSFCIWSLVLLFCFMG